MSLKPPSQPLTPISIPHVDANIAVVTVTKWLKQAGEPLRRGDPVLEVSFEEVEVGACGLLQTGDLAFVEVRSPVTGVLSQILVQAGMKVAINTVVGQAQAASTAEASGTPDMPEHGWLPGRSIDSRSDILAALRAALSQDDGQGESRLLLACAERLFHDERLDAWHSLLDRAGFRISPRPMTRGYMTDFPDRGRLCIRFSKSIGPDGRPGLSAAVFESFDPLTGQGAGDGRLIQAADLSVGNHASELNRLIETLITRDNASAGLP